MLNPDDLDPPPEGPGPTRFFTRSFCSLSQRAPSSLDVKIEGGAVLVLDIRLLVDGDA